MASGLGEYQRYYNDTRSHQGVGQRSPKKPDRRDNGNRVVSLPVLDGLHHDYRLAA